MAHLLGSSRPSVPVAPEATPLTRAAGRSPGVGSTAAGVVLFGLIALPALTLALAAGYGLIVGAGALMGQLEGLIRILLTEVALLFGTQLEPTSSVPSIAALSNAAIGSLMLAVIGAHGGVVATVRALDRVTHRRDDRRFVRRHRLAMLLTLAGVMLTIGGLIALVALPRATGALGWPGRVWELLFQLRWPMAFAGLTAYLTVLYRVAPSCRAVSVRAALSGAIVGGGLWVLASVALSWWVAGVATYPSLYGAVGSVLVVVLWFYVSALAVLLGGIVSAHRR